MSYLTGLYNFLLQPFTPTGILCPCTFPFSPIKASNLLATPLPKDILSQSTSGFGPISPKSFLLQFWIFISGPILFFSVTTLKLIKVWSLIPKCPWLTLQSLAPPCSLRGGTVLPALYIMIQEAFLDTSNKFSPIQAIYIMDNSGNVKLKSTNSILLFLQLSAISIHICSSNLCWLLRGLQYFHQCNHTPPVPVLLISLEDLKNILWELVISALIKKATKPPLLPASPSHL